MAEDTRRLIPISIKKLEDNLWSIEIDGAESYKVEGDFDSIKRALRRIKGKDGENCGKCKSKKVGTYASMLGELDNNEVHKVNVWKSKVPHSAEEFKKLMESKDMKSITLTKNYLIEGNIIPKGTVLQLKEKLDFLPTDIWEKAKDISDEHERFEFIKAELNKLGDDYSDDEIEDFINKYKTELNESKKTRKISKEDLNDMIMVIKETLEAEKSIDKKFFDEIVEKCKSDKELTTAWDALINADDKTFNKKEDKFWKIFDALCKDYKADSKKTDVA